MSDFLFVCCESGDSLSNVIADDLVVYHDYVAITVAIKRRQNMFIYQESRCANRYYWFAYFVICDRQTNQYYWLAYYIVMCER